MPIGEYQAGQTPLAHDWNAIVTERDKEDSRIPQHHLSNRHSVDKEPSVGDLYSFDVDQSGENKLFLPIDQ